MHAYYAILHFALAAAPLPFGSHRVPAALRHRRLIDHANRLWVSMVTSHNLLATFTQSLLIPLDQFQKTL
jgi:hypothetical protein